MIKFILGLFSGGLGTILLEAGIWGIKIALTSNIGWLSILIFILSAISIIFGIAMTRTIGHIVLFWSQNKKD